MLHTEQNPAVSLATGHAEAFEQLTRERPQPQWLMPARRAALERFLDLGYPTVQNEDWRYTNVTPIARLPFRPVLRRPTPDSVRLADERFTFDRLPARRLVFFNGHYLPEFSSLGAPREGLTVASLAAALSEAPSEVEQHLQRRVTDDANAFALLNTAFFLDGAFIYAASGVQVDEPIHLLYLSAGGEPGTTVHPRNLIVADPGSRLTVLETYASVGESAVITNTLTELVAGENAVVEHCKYQDEASANFHLSALHAHLERSSQVRAHSFAVGGRLARNSIRTCLAGEGVEAILNGLYLTRGEQLIDHHMVVDHASPHCDSHEYFNGILDGRSRGVFHGRILVRPDAQKTDAKQTNKNLLLSDDATMDTKPQLEIYADDVKCTHGATIGQLNEESIFYLRARGIGETTARRILIHAFAGEIIERVQHEAAREELDRLIWDRLEESPSLAGNGG